MLGVYLLVLTACGDLITSIDQAPVLRPAPERLTVVCPDPVTLPNRALQQGEVETLWRQDRAELTDCGADKTALHAYYVDRDRRLKVVE